MTTLYHRARSSALYRELGAFVGAESATNAEAEINKKLLPKRVSRLSQVLLLLSILSSFMYWSSLVLPFSGYLHAGIKWLSIGTLTLIIVRLIRGRQDMFLLAALFCHSLGDIVLAHPYQDLLMYSIGPFLLGHIFYIFTFKHDLPKTYAALKQTLSRARKLLIGAAVIYTTIMTGILVPPLLDTHLVYPIIVYIMVVTTMVILSTISPYRSPWMTVGCWMYIVSDSLIAVNKFYAPLPPVLSACSWPLYYIGQIMISLGLMKEKRALCFLMVNEYFSI